MSETIILAVDVGGTKTACGMFREDKRTGTKEQLMERRYESQKFSGLVPLIQAFLKEAPAKPVLAGIGIAGPVMDQKVEVTNLPWPETSSFQIQKECQIPHVFMMNDMEAQAYGVLTLKDSEIDWLQPGVMRVGNKAVIAAGTGLGEALICMKPGTMPFVSASEGGHSDFAPQCEEDQRLMGFLWREFRHVSWERVISGRLGIKNLYRFHKSEGKYSGAELVEKSASDPEDYAPAVISAYEQGSQIAEQTLKTFVRLSGAEAGNLALKGLALGGVYVIGGLAQRLLPMILSGLWLEHFHNKGRFAPFMKNLPVAIVRPIDLALRGAAHAAILQK